MKLSPQAVMQIKEAEGYHTRLKDGRCKSYLCPAGKWTIGWGCTERVGPGMIWTKDQAEEALAAELAKFEAAVKKLVKVEINQAQFDCLVTFAYNVGSGDGGLATSTLLKLLNKGQYDQVPVQLLRWVMHEDPETKKKVPSRGLRNRRLREISMWNGEHLGAGSEEIEMPQAAAPVDPPPLGSVVGKSGTITGLLGSALAGVVAAFEKTIALLTDAAAHLTGMGPARDYLASMGLTTPKVALAFGLAALAYAGHRRINAAMEGKIG